MNDKLIQSYKRGVLKRGLFGLGFTLLFGVVLVCGIVGITLVPDTLIPPDARLFLFIAYFILVVGAMVAGVVIWLITTNRRVYEQLDQAFQRFGLTSSRYLLSGRKYSGVYRGRQVNVYYYVAGRRTFRAPDLQIYVGGRFGTRLGIGQKNALSQLGTAFARVELLHVADPAYESLLVYPKDETWAQDLLADLQANRAILDLVGIEQPGVRTLTVDPEAVRLQLRHFNLELVTPENLGHWIRDLYTLAEVGEKLHPPREFIEASSWEKSSRLDRSRYLPIALGIVAVMIVCPLVIVGGVFLFLYLIGVFP